MNVNYQRERSESKDMEARQRQLDSVNKTELFFEVEMDSSILLLCKYGSYSLVVKVTEGYQFEYLIGSISNKWNGLLLHMVLVVLRYSLKTVIVELVAILKSVKAVVRSIGNGGVTSSSHSEIVEDPLEKFCPHLETKRLSADWAYLISHVGQEFRGGVKDFRLCLCKYAIEVGFRFKYLKNDQSRVTDECAFKADGCKWFVHTILDKSNHIFCFKELEKEHRCGATICNSKNSRMSSKLIAEKVLHEVRSKMSYKPIEAVRFFRQRYGTTIGYHHAWLGVEMANNETQGDYALSFNELRLYAEVAKEKNLDPRRCLNL
ncbi:hypothetical protein RHGRI_006879 [Rhododendron griersonianum]|uniref:Transposase MuDR plant domain-containing protein n=1 Tax=Rhododendron griersonianum TaxID=479676 RepID=A0AAV6KV21_9ERIC|nr:hypothetical protein RHGRI_006879 [Rhododendron griersonianum]